MQKSKFNLLLQLLVTFSVLSCVPLMYFHNQFNQIELQTQAIIEQQNSNKLEFSRVELQNSLKKVTSSLRFLSKNGLLNQTIRNPSKENLSLLQDFWLLVAQAQRHYSQLRFIDTSGMELIRINSGDNISEIVDSEKLQYKGDRSYFRYAQQLGDNDVGTYGIDYEIENGKAVDPLTPAYRIIYPITIDNQRKGYFIANLDLNRIYQELAFQGLANNLPTVVDDNGYFLMTSSGEQILGHLLEGKAQHNLATSYPKLWRYIQLSDTNIVKENGHWISYIKTQIKGSHQYDTLILLFKTPLGEADAVSEKAKRALYMKVVLVTIILLLLSFFFVSWDYNHKKNSLDSKIARAAMNGMSAVVITDKHNQIIQVNDEFTRLSGYQLQDVIGQRPSLFASGKHGPEFYQEMWHTLNEHGVWEGEVINKRRDGSFISEILRIQTIKNRAGSIEYHVASFVDISHLKELEERLRTLSEKDALTELNNRRKFDSDIQAQMLRCNRYGSNETAILALIDIDHFKRVNDNYGHDIGDQVLIQVAKSLTLHLRETDMIFRIGGEEFAVIMPHIAAAEAELVLNRVRLAINAESDIGITVSIGFTDILSSVAQSYKRADTALYQSKSSGRNQVSRFCLTEKTN